MDSIKNFDGLTSVLVSTAIIALNKAISKDIGYIKLNSDFGQAVKIINDDTLAFVFSNYINQEVVRKLNDKSITLAQGSPILFEIYNFCKCNPHLRRNIENIIEALIQNYLSDGDNDNLNVLYNVLSSSREFDQYIVKALKGESNEQEAMLCFLFLANEERFNTLKNRIASKSKPIQIQFDLTATKISDMKFQVELSTIVEGVNKGTMKKCDALEKVYSIYKTHKNNDRVCENLAALIPMCVMEYIVNDKIGKGKVEAVLNALKYDISSAFKSHNSEIGAAYDSIWNHLSHSAKIALMGSPASLTPEGKALKKGLDYLKILR
jgi:hypothetical protein